MNQPHAAEIPRDRNGDRFGLFEAEVVARIHPPGSNRARFAVVDGEVVTLPILVSKDTEPESRPGDRDSGSQVRRRRHRDRDAEEHGEAGHEEEDACNSCVERLRSEPIERERAGNGHPQTCDDRNQRIEPPSGRPKPRVDDTHRTPAAAVPAPRIGVRLRAHRQPTACPAGDAARDHLSPGGGPPTGVTRP